MELVLTEDQELLAKTAADFVRTRSPVSRMRALRDSQDPIGFSRALWKEMAELGWVGILIPEAYGGAGMGLADLAVVLEALGRTLAPEPFLSTVLLAGQLLTRAGSEEQKQTWLPGIASGDKILTVAYQEARSRYDLNRVATKAEQQGPNWILSGEKIQVLDGHTADGLIVSARTAGGQNDTDGVTLFLVSRDAPGLTVTRQQRIDSRAVALVSLNGVKIGAESMVGTQGKGAQILSQVVDRATVGLCAEMLGGMTQIFDDTLAYLKTRQQFGVLIGTFQALKHRAARLFMEIELVRSSVMAAARAADADDKDFASLVSLAKARCSDAFILAANEGVQMHGGIGMTDEHDAGFYLKRARVAEVTFGDAAWHRERWARLHRY
ncbi:MAG TPA: acyl-CoA dehydrogenase family protein [Candidatus Binatia bacterium]|nr:acyl-CoA dehydrogenase family protein [Candidatus Binatia bacterium]